MELVVHVEPRGDPLYLGLSDRECSLFVNPRNGDILMDEGPGEGRVNGAVLFADKEPQFHALPLPGDGGQLLLAYRKHLFALGTTDDLNAIRDWAEHANRFLATKSRRVEAKDDSTTPASAAAPQVFAAG